MLYHMSSIAHHVSLLRGDMTFPADCNEKKMDVRCSGVLQNSNIIVCNMYML